MNSVNIDVEKGKATLGGGTLVEEMIAEAHKQKAQVRKSHSTAFYSPLWRGSIADISLKLLAFAIALVFSVQRWEVVSVGVKACTASELITCFQHVLLLQKARLLMFLLPKILTFGGACVALVIILGSSRVLQ
jgi:hypothetical protein